MVASAGPRAMGLWGHHLINASVWPSKRYHWPMSIDDFTRMMPQKPMDPSTASGTTFVKALMLGSIATELKAGNNGITQHLLSLNQLSDGNAALKRLCKHSEANAQKPPLTPRKYSMITTTTRYSPLSPQAARPKSSYVTILLASGPALAFAAALPAVMPRHIVKPDSMVIAQTATVTTMAMVTPVFAGNDGRAATPAPTTTTTKLTAASHHSIAPRFSLPSLPSLGCSWRTGVAADHATSSKRSSLEELLLPNIDDRVAHRAALPLMARSPLVSLAPAWTSMFITSSCHPDMAE
mmetsp:Transcript_88415/g.270621  ORF Transcript_88415/g.270621 Transcript_88415/m.270621 type:complete len:295 (+) Transcript_88415:763-1647(+)